MFQSKAAAGEAADARRRAVLHEVRLPFVQFLDSCCTLERGRYVTLGDLTTAFGAFLKGWPIHDPLTARFADRPHLIANATIVHLIDDLSATGEGGGVGLASPVMYSEGTVSREWELGGGQSGVGQTRFMITGLSLDRVFNWADITPEIHPPASLAEIETIVAAIRRRQAADDPALDPETVMRRLRVRTEFNQMAAEVTSRTLTRALGGA